MALTEREIAIIMAGNAFLRAFKAEGVPVRIEGKPSIGDGLVARPGILGQWYIYKIERLHGVPHVSLRLALVCEVCGGKWFQSAYAGGRDFSAGTLLDGVKRAALAIHARWRCDHLEALLERPSEKVIAIAEMEILAGEG